MDNKQYELMIGERGGKSPQLTIAGNTARHSIGQYNLGNGNYCLIDARLDSEERKEIYAILKTYANPPKRRKKAKTDDTKDVTTDES